MWQIQYKESSLDWGFLVKCNDPEGFLYIKVNLGTKKFAAAEQFNSDLNDLDEVLYRFTDVLLVIYRKAKQEGCGDAVWDIGEFALAYLKKRET